ncbi:MAG: CHAT domain-containing protein, partial [Gammaproteobacteria bacterium]|nr:CHAT domain-containing protein [Gammaproteobacteria bacterium]
MSNLADMVSEMGRHAEAEPLGREALAIAEKSVGIAHPLTANTVIILGSIYRRIGADDKAEPLIKRAIAIVEAAQGVENRNVAYPLTLLADLYSDGGSYARAEPLYRRALTIYEKALGPDHPDLLRTLRSLAVTQWARGESQQALMLLQTVQRKQETNSRRLLAAGSEARKQEYRRYLAEDTYTDISFAMATPGVAATVLGLTSVLQHKGRVLDAVSDSVVRLRRSVAPADRALLEELADLVGQVSAMIYAQGGSMSPEQYRARLAQLSMKQDGLEVELANRSAAFGREVTSVTLTRIRQAIPVDAALVEWFRYTPLDPTRKNSMRSASPRYVAYVLKRKGNPVAIDVGEAQIIEKLARRLRIALADSASRDFEQHAAALSTKLLTPLRAHLQGVKHILFSPDGELNLIPMAALSLEPGVHLATQFNVSYLTSGRDLLRIAIEPISLDTAVVIADPDYGRVGVTPSKLSPLQPQRSNDLDRGGLVFRQLPGTALEAQDLKGLLKLNESNVLVRLQASETALKQMKSPPILHIASHGFFLSDRQLSDAVARQRGGGATSVAPSENPLLRSGIALAGANERSSGEEEG